MIAADKTNNYYSLKKDQYQALMKKNIQKNYKKVPKQHVDKLNKEDKKLSTKLDIADRMEKLAEKESFLTLKDHKQNFDNKPECSLINSPKSELAKISKIILERTIKKLIQNTNINIWRNTQEVLKWFRQIENKTNASFITFDVINFYPSIKKKLFTEALDFASNHSIITQEERSIIFQAKKSLLIHE